ncbi:DUF4244 domain-containing protein [Actinomadura luzonensis]|nr:DUF4244 domain-containing protein [Actinomadura luzonensis]
MHSPATTPDTISAAPEGTTTVIPPSDSGSRQSSHSDMPRIAISNLSYQQAAKPGHVIKKKSRAEAKPTRISEFPITAQSKIEPKAPHPEKPRGAATAVPADSRQAAHPQPRHRYNRWLYYASRNRERGMSTAEYAVGTIAACAFAALLMKIVSSTEIQELLSGIISRALNTSA